MAVLFSIAIIGQNEILREGLSRILGDMGFSIVTTSAGPEALVAQLNGHLVVDMIIVDSPLIHDGHITCRTLRAAYPEARIVLLGDDFSIQTTCETMAMGADGYLAKHISCGPLARSLELIALGEKVVPSQTVDAMIAADWKHNPEVKLMAPSNARLSERELGVLRCLTRGDANKVISRDLEITEATVKVHVKAIMRKLGVLNRTQAAIWAVSQGVVDSPIVAA